MRISRVSKGSNFFRAEDLRGITLSVEGYKSIKNETEIEIAPLTLFAGANSSGKSSMMQPLLILKQTFEALYNPGGLLLDAANVHVASPSQILSKVGNREDCFSIKLSFLDAQNKVKLFYKVEEGEYLVIDRAEYSVMGSSVELQNGKRISHRAIPEDVDLFPHRQRGVLFEVPELKDSTAKGLILDVRVVNMGILALSMGIMHIPGSRDNSRRVQPSIAIDKNFHDYVGTFDNYTASVINHWQESNNEKIDHLRANLRVLGLSAQIQTRRINGNGIEINVSRTMSNKSADMVNIADVGFGVSQTLSVLVALLAAEKDQIVYIEQPEIHLHPRAQHLLAKPIVDGANRGARVVVETHSSILLTGIQELGANGVITPDKAAFYWFSRDEDSGATRATRADLDENFAFGDWPEDFSETSFNADMAYVRAAAKEE